MLRGRGAGERGSVAITVVLSMTVLLGFAALVVDVGLNWAARTSAQTAADSAALAGASALLADGPVGAVDAVRELISDNVEGLADSPADPNWPLNGNVSDGEVVCWTLPGDPPLPVPGGNCPDGSNALQVTTPPVQVQYAFAPVLGETANSIRARAAAAAGPAAPNNCVLCLLDPAAPGALETLGFGDVTVNRGIAVNSNDVAALVLAGAGDISAEQIRVIGGLSDLGLGNLIPPAELGGPPVPDPLADLDTPDLLASPLILRETDPLPPITADTTLEPGIYHSVRVEAAATLTLTTGVYVFTGLDGLTIADDARVVSGAGGVTIYLACGEYPEPCSGNGARFQVQDNGRFLASPRTADPYAGLSIFAAPGNTTNLRLQSERDLILPGALYGPSTRVLLENNGDLRVNSLMVVGALTLTTLSGPDPAVTVNYNPSSPLPAVGPPVLIR